jgi:hypothetical protein
MKSYKLSVSIIKQHVKIPFDAIFLAADYNIKVVLKGEYEGYLFQSVYRQNFYETE